METKRVYTKATERLKRLHKEYGGLKSGNPDDAQWFDNTDRDFNSGTFYAAALSAPSWYNSEKWGFQELTEEDFIKFMDLTELDRQLRVADVMLDVEGNDNVNNPSHYKQGSIEPIDYILANGMNFLEGNVVKYVTRYKHKNGLEDLKKAEFYLKKLIAELESK